MGVYNLNLSREWFRNAAPFFRIIAGTLSLVLPVASTATKFVLDEPSFKLIENELEMTEKSIDAVEKGFDVSSKWLGVSDAPGMEYGEAIRGQGAILRQLHALLQEKDPSYGGLTRVLNKNQEYLWVHPQFAGEY